MPIFLFSIIEDPFPLIVLARIQFKSFDFLMLSNDEIRSFKLCPSTSKVFIPRPSILSLIGSKFRHSLVLPKIISEFISIIIVKLSSLLCLAKSSASHVEPS